MLIIAVRSTKIVHLIAAIIIKIVCDRLPSTLESKIISGRRNAVVETIAP